MKYTRHNYKVLGKSTNTYLLISFIHNMIFFSITSITQVY